MLKNSPYIHLLYHDCSIRNYYSKIITCDQNLENKLKPFSSKRIECSNIVYNFLWNLLLKFSRNILEIHTDVWKYTQKKCMIWNHIQIINPVTNGMFHTATKYISSYTNTHDKMLV